MLLVLGLFLLSPFGRVKQLTLMVLVLNVLLGFGFDGYCIAYWENVTYELPKDDACSMRLQR